VDIHNIKLRAKTDPSSRILIDFLEEGQSELCLEKASVYYDFPLYKDNQEVIVSKVILISQNHGVIVFGTSNVTKYDVEKSLRNSDVDLDIIFGHIYSRLIKSKRLRKSKKELLFNLDAAVFAPELGLAVDELLLDAKLLVNKSNLYKYLSELQCTTLDKEIISEIISIIEGAKGLLVPKKRDIEKRDENSKVVQVAALEAEINSFDRDQKHGYMGVLDGPQRIRGLAGSGKTIVLAMKAALTHLKYPDANILFTFYTKSLYQHVQRLITRFYRQYDEVDPNWDKLKIMHAWGGQITPGVYYNACIDHNIRPLTYSDVRGSAHPFEVVCSNLLAEIEIKPIYDYIFVDEGQDFPPSFLRLCLKLAKNNRLVLAYDELQTIFQTEIPSMISIFGSDENGEPSITLDEDVVLHKCYRNPLEILVCAHALGFGIYGKKIVQMLENEEHWKDFGYIVVKGKLSEGEIVEILRPRENSPSSISINNKIDSIISMRVCNSAAEEIEQAVAQIVIDIKTEGLQPEDILVISADDRFAKQYLSKIATLLHENDVATNNLHSDAYGLQDFINEGCVTLSTIHKAKGNEAYVVYILGIDALFQRPNIRYRNMIFTAMTRAKGWLHITGVGDSAEAFKAELDIAKKNCPSIIFKYPSEHELKVMKRDLMESIELRADRALDELQDELPLEEFKKVLSERLRRIKITYKKNIKSKEFK
jgi:superfamily I DNA and RNA helicase